MNHVISNENVSVEISSVGGELMSIKTKDCPEYLWQGDPAFWSSRAPHLFPYVGRLTNGQYTLDSQVLNMGIHGFFRFQELTVSERKSDRITFQLESSEKTRTEYPRDWAVTLTYKLSGSTLETCFQVKNRDSKTMFFGYGGHPGFRVPLKADLKFEDYYLEFGKKCAPISVGMTPACYIGGPDAFFLLTDETKLPLRHELFDNDAIILRDMDSTISLKSDKDPHGVTVTYPQMPYLGLWHKPHSEAPYVCIEPWVSLPSRQDIVEALETQGDMVRLAPGEKYKNCWSITVF